MKSTYLLALILIFNLISLPVKSELYSEITTVYPKARDLYRNPYTTNEIKKEIAATEVFEDSKEVYLCEEEDAECWERLYPGRYW